MSPPEPGYTPPDISLLGDEHVRRYEETNGEVGHEWNGATCLVLTAVGRKTGQPRKFALRRARRVRSPWSSSNPSSAQPMPRAQVVRSMHVAYGPPPVDTTVTSCSGTWRGPASPRNCVHASCSTQWPCMRPAESCPP